MEISGNSVLAESMTKINVQFIQTHSKALHSPRQHSWISPHRSHLGTAASIELTNSTVGIKVQATVWGPVVSGTAAFRRLPSPRQSSVTQPANETERLARRTAPEQQRREGSRFSVAAPLLLFPLTAGFLDDDGLDGQRGAA